ncbi:hypothetical protein Tco_0913597 [Tanacetum coccineum]
MIVYSLPYSVVGGIVALSVIATALCLSCSVMTPILATKLAGQYVALDVIGLLMPTLHVRLGGANVLIHVVARKGEDLSLGES